ncbi:MAG: RNA-binding protein [Chitinophagales bacterium]|nr:RNA-binding protein [Chitinophagales bacterium]
MDLYVGSIPFKWKEKDLLAVFSAYGEVVDVKVVIDNITRQNKGFGFVTMSSKEAAMRAVEALDGSEHLGRTIIVQLSKPKTQQDSSPSGRKGTGSTEHENKQPFWKRRKKS